MKNQIKVTLKPQEDLEVEDFYDKEDEVLEKVENIVDKMNNKYEEVELEVEKNYIEWAKPYGHDPYLVLEYREVGVSARGSLDELDSKVEEKVDKVYDKFEVSWVESSGII
jgi:hypothetical protein